MADGTTLHASFNGEWFEITAIQTVPVSKVLKVASSLDEKDDAEHMLSVNMTAVMDALDAPLKETSTFMILADGQETAMDLECPSLEVEHLTEKLAAVTSAFQGVLQLAKLSGAADKDITTAFMLASGDAAGGGSMDPMAAAMAAQMGGMAAGMGQQGQCQQQ